MSFSKYAALAIAAAFITAAHGGTIISNTAAAPLNDPGVGAVDFTAGAEVGTQFTIGATSFNNVSFSIAIAAIGARVLGPNDIALNIYGGDTTSPSGASLLSFPGPGGPFSANVSYLTYTAPAAFTLNANTTYWLVVNATTSDQEGATTFDNTIVNRQPTGPGATAPLGYNRSSSGLPTSIFSTTNTLAFEVDGTAVTSGPPTSGAPEPSTVAMISVAAAALGFRKFARRSGSQKAAL